MLRTPAASVWRSRARSRGRDCSLCERARAARSPRASEVGARGEPARVDRASTRDTLAHKTNVSIAAAQTLPRGDGIGRRPERCPGRSVVPLESAARRGHAASRRTDLLWSSSARSHRPEGGSASDHHPPGPRPRAGLVAEGDRTRAEGSATWTSTRRRSCLTWPPKSNTHDAPRGGTSTICC